MGCGTVDNDYDNKKDLITIEKKQKRALKKDEIINEKVIQGYSDQIEGNNLALIGKQKDESICKIIKKDKRAGTEFLSYSNGYKKD